MIFLNTILKKIKKRIWSNIVSKTYGKSYYPILYRSYWHLITHSSYTSKIQNINYFAAIPNSGAGIGHQLANWIAGYWFSGQLELNFAHIPFSTEKWEDFLGFGEDEITVNELIKYRKYQKVRLPLFDENNLCEINLIKKIIRSYQDKKIVFIAEQDQFYKDQFGVMEKIKLKFHHAKARKNDQLIYFKKNFNIAIHVRRGDIVIGKETNINHQKRWQDNSYFEKVLSRIVEKIKLEKPIAIYLFSQGEQEEFQNFQKFENIHFCLDMSAQDTFLHMINADLLITSKSSFSYKPALLSNGIKVCPRFFWHGYPVTDDWVLVNDDATFDINQPVYFKIN